MPATHTFFALSGGCSLAGTHPRVAGITQDAVGGLSKRDGIPSIPQKGFPAFTGRKSKRQILTTRFLAGYQIGDCSGKTRGPSQRLA